MFSAHVAMEPQREKFGGSMFPKLQLSGPIRLRATAVPAQRLNVLLLALTFAVILSPILVHAAQGSSGSSSINGVVTDPSGAVVPGATVEIRNPVSQYSRTTTTDNVGDFSFANVPVNSYHMTVSSPGFTPHVQDIQVRSTLPLTLKVILKISSSAENVTVQGEASDLLRNEPTYHTNVDRNLLNELPLESTSSQLSSAITLSSPGIAADSNGQLHGMGDHAENSFSLDGQPITDQQSKIFSNQIPLDAVQSMTVIGGAPPAEYGDKTSMVIDVTTRSGLGVTTPHGNITTSYGTFGTSNVDADFTYGGKNWGNFIAVNGLNTGRFLDTPEFSVLHDHGNEENLFDRVDYQLTPDDSLHFDFQFTRSWFQNPNSYDQQFHDINGIQALNPLTGLPLGPTDQRSQILTFDVAPTWTHIINDNTLFTLNTWTRRDGYNYYPSADPFNDLGPVSLQRQTVGQQRSLLNAGATASLSYTKGIHNIKTGITYEQTFLNENDQLGIIDPTYNAPCLNGSGIPVNGFTSPAQCALAGFLPNVAGNPIATGSALYPYFNPVLLPYDLSRGGTQFAFAGHTDIKELAMYVEDTITKGHWSFNLGIRGDFYNGLVTARQAEPRTGVAYNIAKTNTVLRFSYARTLETPFNENLVLSSVGCSSSVLGPLLGCTSSTLTPVTPGYRNEYHVGLEQAFGRYVVVDGEYIWKYTTNAYDFSVLGNTPIAFPIEWAKSKIPGFALRVSMPNYHGVSALVTMSGVAARFFEPQIAGAGAAPLAPSGVFRIDHDEAFNQTTHVQYQTPWKRGPWVGFNWRFDSGLVAGASPCFGLSPSNTCPGSVFIGGVPYVSMVAADYGSVPLSADQEFQAGFFCGSLRATPTQPLPFMCPASQFGSTLLQVPSPGTENDDRNPPRVASRNLFDLAIGDDNLLGGDKYKWSAQLTFVNLANDYALYNFLSTFSGTHYVTPRTITAELGFHF